MIETQELLKKLVKVNEEILSVLKGQTTPTSGAKSGNGEVVALPENDFYDPKVRFDPSAWKKANKPSMRGKKLSETSTEFLKQYAHLLQWVANEEHKKNEQYNGKPCAPATLKQASAALRWAIRLDGQATPDARRQDSYEEEAGDLPF